VGIHRIPARKRYTTQTDCFGGVESASPFQRSAVVLVLFAALPLLRGQKLVFQEREQLTYEERVVQLEDKVAARTEDIRISRMISPNCNKS
jgi:hypothetical protein